MPQRFGKAILTKSWHNSPMNRRQLTTSLLATSGLATLGLAGCQGDAAQALIGKKLPALTGMLSTGAPFQLNGIAKPAVIRLWGMWCGPCMIDMPHWLSVVRALRNPIEGLGDITVLTIHVGKAPANGPNLNQWVAEQAQDVATPVVNDPEFAMSKAIGISGTPSTLYIGPDGAILEHSWAFKNARGVASFIRKVKRLHAKA
jgi:thiol-disulfide isomerase/thioredoxin